MCGINTVQGLCNLPNEYIDELYASDVSRKVLTSTIEKIQHANPGAYESPLTDHRTKANPYMIIYPKDHKKRLAALSAMKSCVCIKNLVL